MTTGGGGEDDGARAVDVVGACAVVCSVSGHPSCHLLDIVTEKGELYSIPCFFEAYLMR